MNVAPLPDLELDLTAPPICLAKPKTWLRPRPVPSPKLLVVKNGSNTRSITSGGMPVPVSATCSATCSPFRPSGAVKNVVVRADPQSSAVLHRVARVEGEVEHRELERAGIGVDRPQLVGNFGDQLDVAAQRRPDQRGHVARRSS